MSIAHEPSSQKFAIRGALDGPIIPQCRIDPIRCAICLTVSEEITCWLRVERGLWADLFAARGSDDAEVLAFDLRAAGRQIDALLALARGEAA
jgi:hypothetical protein